MKQGSIIMADSTLNNYANITTTDGSIAGATKLINYQTGRIMTDIPTGAERSLAVSIENHGVFEHRKFVPTILMTNLIRWCV